MFVLQLLVTLLAFWRADRFVFQHDFCMWCALVRFAPRRLSVAASGAGQAAAASQPGIQDAAAVAGAGSGAIVLWTCRGCLLNNTVLAPWTDPSLHILLEFMPTADGAPGWLCILCRFLIHQRGLPVEDSYCAAEVLALCSLWFVCERWAG